MKSLVDMYADIASMTLDFCKNECDKYCDCKYRCCDNKYCLAAKRFAKEKYDTELSPTGNKELLYMDEHGCIVPPYLRPICSLHACSISYAEISALGNKTKEYFSLREEILKESELQNKQIVWE